MTTHTGLLAVLTAGVLTLGLTACTSDNEDTVTTSTASTEQSTTNAADIPGTNPDPRCQPMDVAMISGILNDDTLTPTNGQVISDGDNKWIGASLMRADGKMESRSDVWLMNHDGLFSVSSGARNASWAAHASDMGYSASDENAQAVDNCVVALTRNGAATTEQAAEPDPTPAASAPEPAAPPEAASAPADNGFESGGIVDGPVVPDPDIPGANQPLPGEPGYTGPLTAEEFENMSNAERSNHGFSAATPANCDGMQGAHEDSEALNC